MHPAASNSTSPTDFLVVCLCAEWCNTCRDYRAGFTALATQFSDTAFRWVDIEDAADAINSVDGLADIDIENFPTLLIFNQEKVVFFGPMMPQPGLLDRTFKALRELKEEDLFRYISANETHRQWQQFQPLREVLLKQPPV
ncbi:MAG: thioredoxin family protein [Rugosibacter sp.]|nr:thioredoxin family protein [Rugosibacter sp.]